MKYLLVICYFFLTYYVQIQTLSCEKLIKTSLIKTSLIVPCCWKHASQINFLLSEYEQQTELPDEVIISISECARIDSDILKSLQNKSWIFPVKIILSNKVQYAGTNRNIACQHATGDIYITQDADDFPHPQRIQIIKYIFNQYNTDHLMHGYISLVEIDKEKDSFYEEFKNFYNLNNLPIIKIKQFNEIWQIGKITNGNIAISKKVFNKIQWSDNPRGQDTEFNEKVSWLYQNTYIVKIPLLIYRSYLSSIRNNMLIKTTKSIWSTKESFPVQVINYNSNAPSGF